MRTFEDVTDILVAAGLVLAFVLFMEVLDYKEHQSEAGPQLTAPAQAYK